MLFNKSSIDYNSIILFVHLPKSGGSSVRENLIKYFKSDQILRIRENNIHHYYGNEINSYFEYKTNNSIKKWLKSNSLINKIVKLKNHLKKNFEKTEFHFRDFYSLKSHEMQKLRFISSNQERNVVPRIMGKHYLMIMVIRDPVERIQSYYFQAKKKGGINKKNKPYILAANKYDVDDFIKFLYDYRPYMVKNPYSVCISGTEDFSIAKEIIDTKFFLAAPIERMDEFSEALTSKLFKKKDKFQKYNVSTTNPEKIIISDKLIELINSTNQTDIKLKKHIELEFDAIIKNTKY